MLKIKDNTTRNENKYHWCDIDFWDNELVIKVVSKNIKDNLLIITDDLVEEYNNLKSTIQRTQMKSNSQFVRRVRKLNKEGCFDER